MQSPPSALDEKTQPSGAASSRTANFGGAVSLFMRSPAHRHYTLADLEWCLLPALAAQSVHGWRGEASGRAGRARRACALGAGFGGDRRAAFAAPRYPIRLHPNEWQSGDVFWIVDAVGEHNAVQQCIEALAKTAFQGKPFKMLSPSDKTKAEPLTRNPRQATGV